VLARLHSGTPPPGRQCPCHLRLAATTDAAATGSNHDDASSHRDDPPGNAPAGQMHRDKLMAMPLIRVRVAAPRQHRYAATSLPASFGQY
jgi:hypothetical protein